MRARGLARALSTALANPNSELLKAQPTSNVWAEKAVYTVTLDHDDPGTTVKSVRFRTG